MFVNSQDNIAKISAQHKPLALALEKNKTDYKSVVGLHMIAFEATRIKIILTRLCVEPNKGKPYAPLTSAMLMVTLKD